MVGTFTVRYSTRARRTVTGLALGPCISDETGRRGGPACLVSPAPQSAHSSGFRSTARARTAGVFLSASALSRVFQNTPDFKPLPHVFLWSCNPHFDSENTATALDSSLTGPPAASGGRTGAAHVFNPCVHIWSLGALGLGSRCRHGDRPGSGKSPVRGQSQACAPSCRDPGLAVTPGVKEARSIPSVMPPDGF